MVWDRYPLAHAARIAERTLTAEIAAAGGRLDDIQHGAAVAFGFTLAETASDALVARLGELCQGRIVWERPE